MNFEGLSNYQLYEIIQNQKLNNELRKFASQELTDRNLSAAEVEVLIEKYDSNFKAPVDEPLSFKYKIIAIIIPFFWVVHVLMTSKYLARGQKRKWNEYWLYFCLGLILWTIVFVIIAKYSIAQK